MVVVVVVEFEFDVGCGMANGDSGEVCRATKCSDLLQGFTANDDDPTMLPRWVRERAFHIVVDLGIG